MIAAALSRRDFLMVLGWGGGGDPGGCPPLFGVDAGIMKAIGLGGKI